MKLKSLSSSCGSSYLRKHWSNRQFVYVPLLWVHFTRRWLYNLCPCGSVVAAIICRKLRGAPWPPIVEWVHTLFFDVTGKHRNVIYPWWMGCPCPTSCWRCSRVRRLRQMAHLTQGLCLVHSLAASPVVKSLTRDFNSRGGGRKVPIFPLAN